MASLWRGMRSMSQLFRSILRFFGLTFSSVGDKAVREMGRLVLIVLLIATPAEAVEWLPLEKAIPAARASDRIILLYVRTGGRRDKQTDEWIAHVDSHKNLRLLLDDVVAATSQNRKPRSPQLLVLDPGGVVVADLGFHEYGNLAVQLAQLRQQAHVLAKSVQAREAGHVTESLLLRADALLNAGGMPKQDYAEAEKLAREAHDDALAQAAKIGLATVASLESNSTVAIRLFREILARPARPVIGARAALLLGHELKMRGFRSEAIDAYQKSWQMAPKDSELANAARRFLEMMGSAPQSDVKAVVAAGDVRLLYPHRAVLAGDLEVSAAAPPAAARVDFFLDDARVAERTRQPFVATIGLGRVPRVHTIRAVAFDAHGTPLGEDAATINERATAFEVEIIAPRGSIVESKTVVEVKPHIPQGRRVETIDLYWNEKKLATLTAPPFRYTLTLPSPRAFGYIRAVARDATGATAEDAKLINSEGSAAEVRVDAVEIHAIVEERDGHNVEGLTAHDFEVKEDGVPVKVEVRNDANDPITVGMAVDVSGSMREAMSSVMDYATEFLNHSLSPGDQTFLVSFAESPELFQPLTSDFEHVSASILDMNAAGATALWDAVIFSLDQLRAVPGKRALLLFTDGVDNGSRSTAKAALEYAQEVGVPVYVVLLYTGPMPTFSVWNGYGSVTVRNREEDIRALAEQTGGSLIRYPRQQDLPKLFQQVRDDTRGAYTLTFVSLSTKKRTEMRKLSVAVRGRRGVVVRAPSAYYPR
jgi:VWFA-related protein